MSENPREEVELDRRDLLEGLGAPLRGVKCDVERHLVVPAGRGGGTLPGEVSTGHLVEPVAAAQERQAGQVGGMVPV